MIDNENYSVCFYKSKEEFEQKNEKARKLGVKAHLIKKNDGHYTSYYEKELLLDSVTNLLISILGSNIDEDEDEEVYEIQKHSSCKKASDFSVENLIEIEQKLLEIFGRFEDSDGYEMYEQLDGETLAHTSIGSFTYYYLVNSNSDVDEVFFRIFNSNHTKDGKYSRVRMHDFNNKYIPYGVLKGENL